MLSCFQLACDVRHSLRPITCIENQSKPFRLISSRTSFDNQQNSIAVFHTSVIHLTFIFVKSHIRSSFYIAVSTRGKRPLSTGENQVFLFFDYYITFMDLQSSYVNSKLPVSHMKLSVSTAFLISPLSSVSIHQVSPCNPDTLVYSPNPETALSFKAALQASLLEKSILTIKQKTRILLFSRPYTAFLCLWFACIINFCIPSFAVMFSLAARKFSLQCDITNINSTQQTPSRTSIRPSLVQLNAMNNIDTRRKIIR